MTWKVIFKKQLSRASFSFGQYFQIYILKKDGVWKKCKMETDHIGREHTKPLHTMN